MRSQLPVHLCEGERLRHVGRRAAALAAVLGLLLQSVLGLLPGLALAYGGGAPDTAQPAVQYLEICTEHGIRRIAQPVGLDTGQTDRVPMPWSDKCDLCCDFCCFPIIPAVKVAEIQAPEREIANAHPVPITPPTARVVYFRSRAPPVQT